MLPFKEYVIYENINKHAVELLEAWAYLVQ